jgi:hypothetical protein
VFSVVGPNVFTTTLQLKSINSVTGKVNPNAILGNDTKSSDLGVIQANIINGAKNDGLTLQTYPSSTILVSDDFSGTVDIMQISKNSGYPLLEVYYGYRYSILVPWQYYFRVETIDKDYAYVILSDFNKKSVWTGLISRSTYDSILSSSQIPDWTLINKGG